MKQHIFLNGGTRQGLFSCLNQFLSSGVKFLDTEEKVYFDLISPFYCYKDDSNALDLLLDQEKRSLTEEKVKGPALIRNLQKLHASYKKYFEPLIKRDINLLIDSFIEKNFKGKTLGIHVRSTDRKLDCMFGEKWERLSALALVREVEEVEGEYNNIFIATDYIEYRDSLIDRFGDKVCYYSSNISTSETDSIHHNSALDREKNMIEAFADALLLSRCDFLLRTMSNFTIFTLSVNPDLPFLDLSIKYKAHKAEIESWLSKNP